MRETTNRFVSKHLATVLQRNFLNLKNDSKKLFILPLFILTMLFAQQGIAQSTANYTFATNNNGTLAADLNSNTIDMTTGTTGLVTTTSSDQGVSAVTNIGFDFFLNGNRYSQFSASANGIIQLGGTVVSGSTYVASGGTTALPKISAFGADLGTGTTGSVKSKVVGSAPNRCLVIEFSNMTLCWTSSYTNDGTYQVRLYETSGVVEFVYGAMSITSNASASDATVSIGFSTNTTATNFAYVTTSANTSTTSGTFTDNTTYATGAITNLNSAANGSRRFYRWTPPTIAAPTGISFTAISGTGMTVNWTAASPTTNILKYAVYYSTDGGATYTFVNTTNLGVNTLAVTGLTPGTTYDWRVVAVSEGAVSTALTGTQATSPPATYYWVGTATAEFNTAATWNTAANGTGTARTTALTSDVLIVDGAGTTAGTAITAGTINADATIGQLRITNNTPFTLSSVTARRTITITGSGGDDFIIENGSTLNLTNATAVNTVNIVFTGTGNTGDISGTLNLVGGAGTTATTINTLNATGGTSTLVTVKSTGIVNITTTTSVIPLVGTAATLSFANSSNCNVIATTLAPAVPLATWGTSSNLTISGLTSSTTPATNNVQSFGNFIYDCPGATGTMSWFTTATTGVIKGNLQVKNLSTGIFRLLTSGTLAVNGNIIIDGTGSTGSVELMSGAATLNVSGNINVNNASILKFANGTGTANITGNVTVSNTAVLNFGNAAGAHTANITGNLNLNSSGTSTLALTSGVPVVNVSGNFNQTAGSFQIGSGTGSGTLRVAGSFTAVSITNPGTSVACVIDFNGTTSQAVSPGSTFTGLINIRVSNPSGISITGTLPVNNGATFTAAANGTAVTSGTVTYGTTTVLAYVTALGAQTCGNEFPASSGPVSLTINNTNATTPNVSLSGSRTVTGTLTITAGRLLLGNNDLTLANGGTQTITTPGATKMIVTDGTGLYKRGIPATTGTYLFPIGETTGTIQYSPVSLQFTANSTIRVIGAKVVDAVSGNMNTPSAPTDYLSRYWTFSENGAGGTYNYYINPALAITGAEDEVGTASSITAAYWDGSGWVPSAGTYTSGSLTSTNTGVSETAAPLGVVEWTGRVAKPVITLNSFLVTSTAISGTISQCSATSRDISVNVIPSAGTLSSVNITYNNGSAVGPVAMTNTSGSTYTYTIPAASPTNTNVTWSITATNSLGSSATYTGATYQDNPNVGITATAAAAPTSICAGASTSLSVAISKSGNATIGTGTGTNSTSSAVSAWFGTWYGNGHAQILILASELTAVGLKAGNLTGLNIPITSTGSPTTLNNYTVKIGATSATAITTFQAPTFTTVWGPTNFTPSVGTNSFTFTTPFNWNGTSNIIIDYCYANSVTGSSSAVNTFTTTAFGSFVNYNADGVAGAGACGTTTVSNTSSNRPNFVLVGNTAPTPTAFDWSDGSGTVGTTNPLSQSPTTNTSYTCTATVNGCPVVSTTVPVTVTTVAPPTAVISSSSQCGSAIPTVSVTPSGLGVAGDLRWYDASSGGTLLQTGGTTYGTAISSNTTFYVAQVSGSCESTTRTALTVTVVSPDALSASATSTTICQGASIDLSTSQTGSTNSYALTWTSSPVSGSGIGAGGTSGSLSPSVTTVTPTAPGTYIYTITGVDGSCTATNTVSVTVGAAPAITTSPSNASIVVGANTSFTVVASNTPTSYVWEVNTGSGWTTVTNGGVYTNATTATLNITGAIFAMNGYQYRVTASNSCGSSTVSATATLTVTIVYCTPSSSGTATYINSFSTSSGLTNISNLTTGYTTGGYINYSASLSASQYQNTAITCNITYVGGTAGLGIWVDWNNNGSFLDAGENVYNTSGCVATGTYNPSFTIPTSQPAGNYRMRVVVDYVGCTPTPCAIAGTRGEVEDYTLTVVVPPTPTITSLGASSGCTGSSITINGTNFIGITAANVRIGGTAVTSITSFTSTQIIAVIGSGTTGTVSVITGGGTATSSGTFTILSLPANPAAPTSNSPQCTSPGVTLTATGSAPGGETWYWQTTASGTTINAGVNDQPTYNVTSSGTYYIRSYNGNCWSIGAGSLAVTVNTVPSASITPTPANSATGVCYAGVGAVTAVSWAATATATSYDVYFGAGSLPGTVTANVTTNSWTISTALAASTTYFWRVVAKNACGDAVGSATWSFTTNNVPCTCPSVPTSNDASGITGVTVGSATFAVADVTYFNYTAAIPDLTTGTTISSSVTFATGYTYDTHIWIDLNDDGVFDNTTERLYTGVSTTASPTTLNTSFALGSGATLGLHKMRIGTADNGQTTPTPCYSGSFGVTIDLVVNVVAPVGCTGTPSGGTVTVTPAEGAPSSSYAVSATGYTSGLGITYLWQSNTNGAGWVDIGTASSTYSSLTSLTAPAFGTVIQYRLLVTCTNSSQSAYSSTGTFTSGYCTPSGSNGSYWITNFTTTTGITNINNTSAAGVGGYSNFTAQSCSQYQGSAVNLSISTNTSTHYFYVWVDWNNDGDFGDAGEDIVTSTTTFLSSYSGSYTIPLTQAAGSYRMRIANNWSVTILTSCGAAPYGEYEDYIFTVVALPACSGTPSAGTVVYSGATLCANVGSATITNSGFTTGFSGLTYQWLSSNDNFATDTSSVSGGSNPASLSTGTLTATTSYLVRAFCSNSGIYSYSNKITVPVNAPAISTTVPASRCDAGALTISATGTSGSTIRWYSALTGGTLLQTGPAGSGADAYTTVSLPYTSNNIYYVEALNGTCTSIPRTAVTANVVPPTTNPTISPTPTITICRDSILTLNASGSTVATTTLLNEGFESTTFLPSTFNIPTPNGDGDYFQSSSYYFEGTKAIGLYSETDFWDWFGLFGEAGNVNMVQAIPMDLSSYLDAKLTFYHICATEDGYDFGLVQYNDGSGWQNFPASAYTGSATLADANGNSSITDQIAFDKASYSDWDATFTDDLYDYLDISATGYDPGNSSTLWKRESIDLTPFMTNNFRVRFRYTFDDVTDYYGWLIDSIAITGNQAIKYAWSPNTGLYTNAAATTAYDSLTTPNAATVYAKPTATTTYKAIAYTGPAPATCSGNASVTVNVTQKPTATINAARPYLCDATAQLSVSALTPPTATINWTNASGTGSASATGSPATVSGLAGTTVYNVKATDGVCVDVPLGTSTVVTPSVDNSSIATSPSAGVSVCNYCVYQDGNTKTYYNSTDGKIIASITDETSNAASLGETEICFKALSGPGSVTDNIGYTQPYLGRVWTIHPAAGSRALVTLYFTDAELAALQAAANSGPYQFSGYYSLSLTKYSNGGSTFTPDYTAPASTGGTGVSGNFSSFNTTDHKVQFAVDDFSTFYIHPVLYPFAALPVELVSFTGWNAGEKNELEWKTASELNTLKFVVEKKIDGGSFTYLGELPAAGNSSQLRTYNFSDLNPVVGNNYYRLKIIDTDGKFSYSNIINVPLSEVLTNNFVSVYPNPTGGELNVGIQSTAAYDTKVLVYDIIGTKMFEQNKDLIKGLNTVQFDFSSFAKGAYILHFTDNTGKTHTTKFVKD